ncbi:aminodeoxychorismate lyase [Gordonia hydrophobica]|uniref:Aminodeoxychorismate lyase n=1 Tax=Gordonia hydrophobica TaxID=40516 RepID=A0ABZ2U3S4_9ACTN|nr:aminodeoxychorismate lyase [Gordonia hydrophobica]MBM7367859.1 4-amino-4-deoxychorismate lyase [Gordonia hydrophobica]
MTRVLVSGEGRVCDPDVPLLHADDLGLLHGDGVFETMLVRAGGVCGLARHLRRLAASVGPAGLPAVDPAQVERAVGVAVREWSSPADGVLRVVYTRGRDGGDGRPTLFVSITPAPARAAVARRDGVRAVSLPTAYRPGLAATAPWLLTGVKSLSYAANVAALRHVQSLGVDDAVFLAADGTVLEGPRSSVVAVIDGVLVTPRRDDGILPGTTQEALFELAAARGIETSESALQVSELYDADEVWLLSSITLAARIRVLDEQVMGAASVLDVAALVAESAGS